MCRPTKLVVAVNFKNIEPQLVMKMLVETARDRCLLSDTPFSTALPMEIFCMPLLNTSQISSISEQDAVR